MMAAFRGTPSPAWALHYGQEAGRRAGFHVVADGGCWALMDDGSPPVALATGDVVVFPHGVGHTLADNPATPAIELGDYVADLAPGGKAALPMGEDGRATTLLCGSYFFGPDGANPLLRGLPGLLHIPAGDGQDPQLKACLQLLAAEAGAADSGSAMVVARLVDLLFVYALRAWLASQARANTGSWFGALADPIVGAAIRAIHAAPDHPRALIMVDVRDASPAEILAFWREAGRDRWYARNDAFDAEVRRRYHDLWRRAAAGEMSSWATSDDGALALALVIVLDQFPRNMFRNDALAYSSDHLAREAAGRAISRGADARIDPGLREFPYIPFMHSEHLPDQTHCIELFRKSGNPENLKYAEQHADIIRRFGRFPHRNHVLGRATTSDEQAFLDDGGSSGG